MRLNSKRILIYGSASPGCSPGALTRAHDFVRVLVRAILENGGSIVGFAPAEPCSNEDPHIPIVFDWTILEETCAFLCAPEVPGDGSRCWLVTSPKSELSRIPEVRRELYRTLKRRADVRLEYLPDETYAGETIRKHLLACTDAIVTIGGGKGVTLLANARGERPLLPLDLKIGASLGDGEGSLALRREAVQTPERFFPHDPEALKHGLPRVTLLDPEEPVNFIAERAIDLLSRELLASEKSRETGRPPGHIPERPVLHSSVTRHMLDLQRIQPWATLSDRESLYSIDKLTGTELDEIRRRLERYGICRIRFLGQAPDAAIIEALARNFGDVLEEQNDYRGAVKEISPQAGVAAVSGDSAGRLGPHVDGTQYVRPPALLIFQYIRNADYGSESTFWDMAHVLLELEPAKRSAMLVALAHPEAGHFGKKGLEFKGPMVVATTQNTAMIRERFDKVVDVHETVRETHEYLLGRLKKQGMVYLPARGDVVIFDNGRVMHGREDVGGDPSIRRHRRMWIADLRDDLQTELLLGIRPVDVETLAKLPRRQ